MKRHLLFFLAFTFLFVSLGVSKSNSQDIGAFIYEHFTKKEQIKALPKQITMEEAIGVQKAFVSLLGKDHGRQIGYKAGLTNPKAQEAFGVKEPVLGILFEKMLLKSGATVNVAFGARPVIEGDLIIRVGDEKINDAKTPEEALSYLDQVIPFIELPDLMFSPDTKLDGPSIVAINVGARLGVVGEPISLTGQKEWLQRLKTMALEISDEKGEMITEGTGGALLGDPMNVVLWIKDELKKRGQALKKGDLLSLGSITKMVPPKPGTMKAKYMGLDPKGPVEISVRFQ